MIEPFTPAWVHPEHSGHTHAFLGLRFRMGFRHFM